MIATIHAQLSRKLIRFGIVLVALAICTAALVFGIAPNELALSHYQNDVLNGIFLIALGAVWPKLTLSNETQRWAYRLAVFGTYIQWFANLLAAVVSAGFGILPFASASFQRQFWSDLFIQGGLICFSLSILITSGILLWGLRGNVKN